MTDSATPREDDLNPYATPVPIEKRRGDVHGEGATKEGLSQPRLNRHNVSARRLDSRFLFRRIAFESPLAGVLTYTGWWFVQRVYWNQHLVWRQISWWTLQREIAFRFPPGSVDAGEAGRIEIEFGRGLRLRRFTVSCDGIRIYEETVGASRFFRR